MMIQKLFVKQIGPFEEATLEFPACRDPNKADIHIFTGPNGSGKSTLLYAIAACLGGPADNILRRMHGDESLLIVQSDEGDVAFRKPILRTPVTITSTFGKDQLFVPSNSERHLLTASNVLRRRMHRWRDFVSGVRGSTILDVSFAPFAYSGSRSLTSYLLPGIQEVKDNPLKDCLSFHQTHNSQNFVQWVANSHAKEALALKESESTSANSYAQTRRLIEDSLSEVLGMPIALNLRRDPLTVLAKRNGTEIELDLLPDGLKSILSWLGDLLMRMDRIPWEKALPIQDREFILLLDEVEIHLHPLWQWKVLPMIQMLFRKAQVFVSTHSPFVIASVDDAWVHSLELDSHGRATAKAAASSKAGESYAGALREVLGVSQEFDSETQNLLTKFYQYRDRVLRGDASKSDLSAIADAVKARGEEPGQIVLAELRQVDRLLEKKP